MSGFTRFFYGEHGAARSYLFARVFPLLLALDTWMLMIGHAGRYGQGGFNVAHFGWLDALLPTPQAGFYVAVLVLTGLLSLVVALTGVRRSTCLPLFALYTLSWAMSMLDSYQHHYLVSLILFCLAFFPQTTATDLHPQLPTRSEHDTNLKGHKRRELERARQAEPLGFLYAGFVLAACALYAFIDTGDSVWMPFFMLAAAIALATFLYAPVRGPLLLRSGMGFNLLGVTVFIVYTYTAIAKMDANWIDGHTLLRISAVEKVYGWMAELAGGFGIERDQFWSLFSTFVIPQELFMGGVYLIAIHQDRLQHRAVRILCTLGALLSPVLHVGAEAMGLEIGWFSAYMLLLGVCYLLPLFVVDRLVTVFTWPARYIQRQLGELGTTTPPPVIGSLAIAIGSALLLIVVGAQLDLPGTVVACELAGAVLVVVTVVGLVQRKDLRQVSLACAVAAMLMWGAIAASPARWDFYRYLGGDLMRRNEPEAALEAYLRGERYAPPGESRAKKIKQLRERLGK